MSIESSKSPPSDSNPILVGVLELLIALLLTGGFIMVGALIVLTSLGDSLRSGLGSLLALDTVQLWWYVTRAAGIVAYLLLWFSTVWGLAVPSRIFDGFLDRTHTYDFHQFISLLSIAFVALHILVLLVDRYLPYTVLQIFVPFLSPYRPLWVGFGVLGFYIVLLVTVTFYMRTRIGTAAFRAIHVLSLLGYVGVTLHAFFAGTDSPLATMQLVYEATALSVVFFTVFWLIQRSNQKYEEAQATLASRARHSRSPARR